MFSIKNIVYSLLTILTLLTLSIIIVAPTHAMQPTDPYQQIQYTHLILSIHENNLQMIQSILETNPSLLTEDSLTGGSLFTLIITHKDLLGRTLFHIAAERGHTKIIEILITHIKERVSQLQNTPTLAALINAQDIHQQTSLHLATSGNHIETAKLLIQHGAILNASNCLNQTPLHIAAKNGHKEIFNLLIGIITQWAKNTGQDDPAIQATIRNTLNQQDKNRHTPLTLITFYITDILSQAIKDNNQHLVTVLFEDYPVVLSYQDQTRKTFLHITAESEHSDIITVIMNAIENQAAIEHRNPIEAAGNFVTSIDSKGMTPLHVAIKHNHTNREVKLNMVAKILSIIVQIAQHTARQDQHIVNDIIFRIVNMQDSDGQTPLHHAAQGGYTRITKELIQNLALINVPDNAQNTPLHIAANNGHTTIISLIIERIINQARNNGNREQEVKEILAHELSQQNNNGFTPIDLAKQHQETLQELTEYQDWITVH